MTSLRKSASFRSRIPVRRAKVPLRRCSSPQPIVSWGHKTHHFWSPERRYSSSSSYSSSDESEESEAPLQRLLRQSASAHHMPHTMATSTDALSLDGLLDSVSSGGSFSSPPNTPKKLQQHDEDCELYENTHLSCDSLERYNSALETLKLTHDGTKQTFSSTPDTINQTSQISPIRSSNRRGGPYHLNQVDTGEMTDDQERRLQLEHLEKQRKLSDWYYIKTSPKPRQQDLSPRKADSELRRRKLHLQRNQIDGGSQRIRHQPMSRMKTIVPFSRSLSHQSEGQHSHDCDSAIVSDVQRNSCGVPHYSVQYQSDRILEKSPMIARRWHQARFGEMSSSSFEHVNLGSYPIHPATKRLSSVHNLYENTTPRESLRRQDKFINGPSRPLPLLPLSSPKSEQYYPPKTTSYQSECELSGSYVSLECPSPPGPPACLPESRRDPQSRLSTFLKTLYLELALKEPPVPGWAQPVAPGALSAARLEPELRLHMQSHGTNEIISVDQLLMPIQTKDGPFLEAPRRVLVECPTWAIHSTLALRILHAWARDHPWPQRGTPVAVAIFIPLAELKGSLSNYVAKELLPKGPSNPFAGGFGGFNSAWNSLSSLKAKLLFVLDGYDTPRGSPKRKGKNLPADVIDLLEGRLFPDARIVVLSVATNCSDLLPMMQRHVTYEGLTWGRSASLLGGGQWGAPTRLLDTVQQYPALRSAVRTTLGCLAIASIYESNGGDLPTEEIDVVESVINCVGSESSANNAAELGRLALFSLKTHRSSVTTSEIRMYCSSPDSTILGCLEKAPLFGRTAKRKGESQFMAVCAGVSEFLAASYLASLASRPGLLAAEIAGLSLGDEIDAEMLKILTFSMSLLGSRAHILLSKLTPLWLSPQTIFSLAIAGGESDTNLNALCDLLGISKSPPVSPLEMRPIWVQIRSTPTELRGWGMALKSPSCTLRNLELAYQMEKNTIHDSRNGMDHFLDALVCNDSVTTLRISSLIEIDAKETEIGYLANCVAKALTKPKLESFELILTLLEEDPPVLKLQAVVSALCRSIPRQPKLSSLLLDLGLCTSQLVQLCSILEKCPQITRVSLPHLRCERGAVGALAALLTNRPITSLALPSCWGARDDPPSSSGVSMGSGSGSSTGTSGLIKQSSLTGAPSPRSYPPGLFSSLPRGVLPPPSSMGRSATLPRQPIECPPDKRSSDSVVSSKPWYPTPACEGGPHNSGTLHDLFLTIREPYSRLNGLDLSKAQLSLEDAMCLGETVRLSTTLHSIKIEGASRLSEILPSVLGASESPCLQMMSIGSPRLALEDGAISMSARALANCSTLKLLSIEGWSFRIESATSLSALRAFLSFTSIRELGLSNCRLHLPIFKSDSIPLSNYECRSVVVIKISGAQVILGDHTILRGPQLLPYIGGFPCLRELDLSAPARSGLGGTTSPPLIMDDKSVITFFQCLHLQFSLLNTLKMCNWILHLDDAAKTLKMVSKSLRNSPLSHIKVDGISVLDRVKKHRIEPQFMHILFAGVPQLRWMGVSLSGMREDQIAAIGAGVLDLKGNEIDIRLSDSTIENARLMTQAIGLDGKFDIRVSTFGTSTGILIHVEKAGNKSLSRKRKD